MAGILRTRIRRKRSNRLPMGLDFSTLEYLFLVKKVLLAFVFEKLLLHGSRLLEG